MKCISKVYVQYAWLCIPSKSSYAHAMVSVLSRYAQFYRMQRGRVGRRMPQKRNKVNREENDRLCAVLVAGAHGRNEKTRVNEGKGCTGQGNHPKAVSTGILVG